MLVVVLHELLLGDESLVAHQTLVRPDVQLAFHVQAQAGQAVERLAAQRALERVGFGVLDVVLPLGKLIRHQADRTLVPGKEITNKSKISNSEFSKLLLYVIKKI